MADRSEGYMLIGVRGIWLMALRGVGVKGYTSMLIGVRDIVCCNIVVGYRTSSHTWRQTSPSQTEAYNKKIQMRPDSFPE